MLNFKPAAIFCVSLLLMLIPSKSAVAQSEESRFEVGAQFSVIGRRAGDDATSVGGGVRLTFNLARYLAIEGELNYFPSAGFDDLRRFQGQFGVKSGLRFDRFGVFGKVRPGFVSAKQNVPQSCVYLICPPNAACIQIFPPICSPSDVNNTGFSLDVGGVLEFYPSKPVTVRFDVGDAIINRRDPPIIFPSGFFAISGPNSATHNLQLSAGVGFRF